MDLLSVIGGLNIIALVFFIPVLGFVIYEVVMVVKENSVSPTKQPTVPKFDPNSKVVSPLVQSANLTIQPHMTPLIVRRKNRIVPIVLSFVLLIVLGGFILINPPIGARSQKSEIIPYTVLTPQVTEKRTIAPTATQQTTLPTAVPTRIPNTEKKAPVQSVTPIKKDFPSPTNDTEKPQELPTAGSYHSLVILTMVATTIVFASLIF